MTNKSLAPTTLDWNAQVSLKLLVEAAPIALAVVNQSGQIVYINTKLEEMFGYDRSELLGQLVELLIPEQLRVIHAEHRVGYLQKPHIRPMGSGLDLAGRRKDGSEFPLEAGLSYLAELAEPMVIVTITDISKRKATEAMLEQRVEERTHEIERRRQVADGLRETLQSLNSNRALDEILGSIVAQTKQLFQASGCAVYRRDPATGRLPCQAGSGHVPSELDAVLLRTHLALDEATILTGGIGASSEAAIGEQLLMPLSVREDAYGFLLIGYQTARHFSKEEIQLAHSVANQTALAIDNAQLHTQIEQSAVAAERNRIARDLHDAVTQTLFSASLIADVLPRLWGRNQSEGERRLAELRELTRGALAEMRTLLLELRPAKLSEVPLADLLHQLAEAIAGRARVAIDVQIEGEGELHGDVKIAFYRIVQEALNNVAKHAHANQATIHLRHSPTLVELSVRDDGDGFVLNPIKPEHLGLGIMRERADAIGAGLDLQSELGVGTTVTVQWQPPEPAQAQIANGH